AAPSTPTTPPAPARVRARAAAGLAPASLARLSPPLAVVSSGNGEWKEF
ncbi:MAG: hypothetical protein JWQ13_3545, partial [Ramlibacter sp.]|nr:hypothetical protein [Ramlibacter sp.]